MDISNVDNLRKQYPKFIYKNYEIIDEKEKIVIKYFFEIPLVTNFEHRIEILNKDFNFKSRPHLFC